MESWGQIASKADILKVDRPLPIDKGVGGKGWAPYYGQYTHMFCDEYMGAVDHPFIQDAWYPMWGDCYVIREGEEGIPSTTWMNLWHLRLHRDSYVAHREFYRNNYCWVPSLGQLIGVLTGKGYWVALIVVDSEKGYWRIGIEGRRQYIGEGHVVEIAMAIALRQLTANLRMKL